MLEGFDFDFERLVVLTLCLLHSEHDIAIHLDEAAVAIPREALVLGDGGQRKDGRVIETQVEDRIHHARHRVARTGADGHQQRHALGVAELAAHDFLHVLHAGFHLRLE